jgi:type I restriction enzyme S subunit
MTEIAEGYKQTEVGVIPIDWEVKKFRDVSFVNQGLQIAIEKRLKQPAPNSRIYLTIQFLNNGKDIEYINDYSSSVCCNEDDVLMTRTGNTGIVISGVNGVFHNNFFKINFDRKTIDKNYLIGYLNLEKTQKLIRAKAGTSTIPDLNHNDFYSIPIPLPSLSEQKAIAQALSDVDAAIAELDRLITKKRNIKQGTMQQLLTGKRRLAGFSGEWGMKRVGDICDFIVPGRNKPRKFEGDIPWITTPDLRDGRGVSKSRLGLCISRDEAKNVGSKIVPATSVIMSCAGELGIVALAQNEIVINQQLHAFIPPPTIDSVFLLNAIKAQKKYIDGVATKTAVPYLNKDNCNSIPILILSLPEQKAIAQVLSDMDSEIEALEQKRNKYKAIKQGMMQELLTGRTRLI